jgi:hypothetical protein
MHFATHSKKSPLLSLVSIVAIVCAFTLTAFLHGGVSHAANAAAPAFQKIKGTVSPASSSAKLSSLPTYVKPGNGTPKVVNVHSAVNHIRTNASMTSNVSQVSTAPMNVSSFSTTTKKKGAGKLLQSFNGISVKDNDTTNGFELAPPDQGLCVGPLAAAGQKVVIEPVNLAFGVYSTSGKILVGPASLYSLFGEPAYPAEFLSDPRCQYDATTKDFFFTILAFNPVTQAESHFDVAVLHQDGSIAVYRFDTTNASGRGCPCFGDQPLLGLDKYNIYVSTNEFPIAPSTIFNGANVYAISKVQLAATAATVNFVEFAHLSNQGILIETLQPAITYDSNAPAEYLLHSFVVDANGNNTSFDHRLGVFAITNQAAVTAGGFPTLSNPTVINSEFYAQPNLAPQPNGLVLNPDDDRMQQVQYINGSLIGELSTAVSIKGDTTPRDGGAWFDIHASLKGSFTVKARVEHQGYIAAAGLYVLYPAATQAKNGTMEMAFSITNGTTNPSAAYAVVPDQTHSKHAGQIFVAATGSDSYTDTFTCSGTAAPGCRWGDYSWATLDPGTSNIWMASEYVPPQADWGVFSNWGTRVYEVAG